jgi:hypothetical protein
MLVFGAVDVDALHLAADLPLCAAQITKAALVRYAAPVLAHLTKVAVKVASATSTATTDARAFIAHLAFAAVGVLGALTCAAFAATKLATFWDHALVARTLGVFTTGTLWKGSTLTRCWVAKLVDRTISVSLAVARGTASGVVTVTSRPCIVTAATVVATAIVAAAFVFTKP